jgi:phosphoserine aminotransferase
VDATSAVLAQDIPWDKIDVLTYSWQKVLGGEAAHGMLILSPRAVERLESYAPVWPLPKIFRLTTKDGKIAESTFQGETINTPSLLCVEDYLDALRWAKSIGGLDALFARADANAAAVSGWVERTPSFDFLARDPRTRSNTGVCLVFGDPAVAALPREAQWTLAKRLVALVEQEQAGFDFGAYRDAPPGLRIWCGATVETSDVTTLTGWIDWAYAEARTQSAKAA